MTSIRIYLDSWNGALHAQPCSSAAAKARAAKRKAPGAPATGKAARLDRPPRDSWAF